MWKIGGVGIPDRAVVVPVAGISNAIFRVTVEEFGTGLVVCEMTSDKGIRLKNRKTLEMLYIDEREYPLSVQIFGGGKETLMEAAKFVEENTQAAIIDINMDYPVNKTIKAEAGVKWLLDPNKVYEMVHTVSSAASLPVTIKTRAGWDEDHLHAADNALVAEQAGASAIATHGRTRVQMYEGTVNWDALKEVKKHLAISFIGNGDVKTSEDAKRMLECVGADGVMIGRTILSNPWIIQRTKEYLETGELMPEPSPAERTNTTKVYLRWLVDSEGKRIAVREFRQYASYYLKGISRAVKVKVTINQVETQQTVVGLLDTLVEKIFRAAVTAIEE